MNYTEAFSLKDKIAIITGASKGIGESIARFFAAYGAKVVISSRKQADLDVLAEDIRKQSGSDVLPFAAHAGDIDQIKKLLDKTIEVFGGVDILVNNAATNPVFGPALDCDAAAFDKIMAVNVRAPFEFSKMVHPVMKNRGGGSIVNISSIAGITPDPGLGIYSVSKASLNMLTKVLAKEWGPDHIRVNSVCPGLIKTKFSQALWENDKILEHFTKRLPIARMGSVEEVAALVLYLSSEASSYTTGVFSLWTEEQLYNFNFHFKTSFMLYDFDKPTNRKNSNSYKWDRYAPEVIPMWIADMDFEVAPPIRQALIDISTHAIVGYNHTPDELTEVVIERLKTKHNWEVQQEWIVWLPGLVPGLHTAARCISDDYYAVMTSSPVYKPFLEAAEIGKRRLQNIPFIWQNDRWEMDFEEMKKTVNPSTRLYMLCNPHNPTGRVFDRSELEQLVAFCLENNLVLCSDEIHCDLILDDAKQHLSVATINKEIENQSITLLAPSKTFNIAGLGCSIAIIPNKELRQNFEKTIYGIMPRPTGFSYEAALAAYKSCEDWRLELVAYLKQSHDYLLKEMNSIPGLSMIAAEATYLAWINYEKTGIENFTEVLEKNGVGVMDAKIFGGEKHFRLNFGTQRAVLEEAVRRIKGSLN